MNVLICLTDGCWEQLSEHDAEGGVVISDLEITTKGKLIRPIRDNQFDESLFSSLDQNFTQLVGAVGHDNLNGFKNLFYECSLRVACSFFDSILGLAETKNANLTFFMKSKIIYSRNSSAYYLSEYESQGYSLYDRYFVVGGYLQNYLNSSGHDLIYSSRLPHVSLQLIYSCLRVYSVLAYKLMLAMTKSIRHKGYSRKKKLAGPIGVERNDILLTSRSVLQTAAVLGFCHGTKFNVKLIIGESLLDRGKAYSFASKMLKKKTNIEITRLKSNSVLQIFSSYLESLSKILSLSRHYVRYRGVEFDVTYAFKELLVMLADVNLYEISLADSVDYNKGRKKLYLSLEQKTAYAYVESKVSRKSNFYCAQTMVVDQYFHEMPCPVFGDYFLADTVYNAAIMRDCFPKIAGRIKSFGSIRSIPLMINSPKRSKKIICYFTQSNSGNSNSYAMNFLVIEKLIAYCSLSETYELKIKLHPRDSIKPYLKRFRGIKSKLLSFASSVETLCNIDIAVTLPSAIVLESLIYNRTLILLKLSNSPDLANYPYWDNSYIGCIEHISDIGFFLDSDYKDFYRDYRDETQNRLGLFADLPSFENDLASLT